MIQAVLFESYDQEMKEWLKGYTPIKGIDYSKMSWSDILKIKPKQEADISILTPNTDTLSDNVDNSNVEEEIVEESKNNDDFVDDLIKENLIERFGISRYDDTSNKEEIQRLNQSICTEILKSYNLPNDERILANKLNLEKCNLALTRIK